MIGDIMRKFLIAILAAALLVVSAAGPSSADDAGLKWYTWAGHCNTQVLLYMHTWGVQGFTYEDGRFNFYTCTNATDRAYGVHFSYIKLWKNPTNPVQVGYYGPVDFDNVSGWNGLLNDTNDPSCVVGQTRWVEAKYWILWQSGSTIVRDDNSYNWTAPYADACT